MDEIYKQKAEKYKYKYLKLKQELEGGGGDFYGGAGLFGKSKAEKLAEAAKLENARIEEARKDADAVRLHLQWLETWKKEEEQDRKEASSIRVQNYRNGYRADTNEDM